MADKKLNQEDVVYAMTTMICGRPGFPVTWQNCERIVRDYLKRLT